MKLEIVIPALNEEQSIKNIIRRCLDSRKSIIAETNLKEIGITVVSDGSTDNTVKFANEFKNDIHIIVFEENKGYGAAIKEGWRQSDAELLSFLDADGTCDPMFFIDLVNLITLDKADISLGCRLNKNSKMPITRKIGNTIFSIMLSFFASQKVKDTASGMRVVRRAILNEIYPLPDGLHFTPAMSAKAVSNPDLKILEKDMTYNEREGESKLNVIKDGIRFFNIIWRLSFMYRPQVFLNSTGFLFGLMTLLLMIQPASFYIENSYLLEEMIYRIIVSGLLSVVALIFFSTSYLSEKIIRVSLLKNHKNRTKNIISTFYESHLLSYGFAIFFICFGVFLTSDSITTRFYLGYTDEHWSRYLGMTFLFIYSFIIIGTKVTDLTLGLIIQKKNYLLNLNKD